MSNLVQQLRDSATQARAIDRAALLHAAAAEIVKIRRQLADLRGRSYEKTDAKRGDSDTAGAALTDAEREAVRFCTTAALPETEKLGGVAGELCRMHAATLRGLLERL